MQRRNLLLGGLAGALSASLAPASVSGHRAPRRYLRTNWSRDPFALGSYSHIARGARRADAARLSRPIAPRLFFAGEAAHPEYTSTVHAAMESGWLAADAVMETSATNIVIVGAGVSGLTVAQTLWDADYDVTVLEARDRIGGRVWTNTTLGRPLDMGASWIHGVHGNPLSDLAAQMGIETVPTPETFVTRDGDGRLIPEEEAPDWLDEVTMVQHAAGTELKTLNLGAYAIDTDYGGPDVIFPGGYAQVLDSFDDDIPVRLRSAVTTLAYSDTAVTLATSDGSIQSFDAAVVTVPLGVLKAESIAFDPPLPVDVAMAIDRLGFGLLDKLYMEFDEVFWDQGVTWITTPENGWPRGQFNQWLNLAKFLDAPILMALNGGKQARVLADLDDATLLSRAQQTLSRAYP